jgi:hypothetical protein
MRYRGLVSLSGAQNSSETGKVQALDFTGPWIIDEQQLEASAARLEDIVLRNGESLAGTNGQTRKE